MTEPPLLQYGLPDTQFGVITQPLPDGGIQLTVPHTLKSKITALSAGGATPTGALFMIIARSIGGLIQRVPVLSHRAVITLNRESLTIVEPNSESGMHERKWPFQAIGELRMNRYTRGVYVSIPGTDNFDLLTDLNAKIVQYVGDTLEQTLDRLRKPPVKVQSV